MAQLRISPGISDRLTSRRGAVRSTARGGHGRRGDHGSTQGAGPGTCDTDILGAIEAGAAGYLLKDVPPDTIVGAIQAAARGEMVLAPDMATRVMRGMRNPAPKLTGRELEVLNSLATGSSNTEIAKALFVSEATNKSHLVHIFTNLGVDSRARAIHVARKAGILRPHQ